MRRRAAEIPGPVSKIEQTKNGNMEKEENEMLTFSAVSRTAIIAVIRIHQRSFAFAATSEFPTSFAVFLPCTVVTFAFTSTTTTFVAVSRRVRV